jgi:peptidyl serine alpha-galactosyltransferase
LQELLEMGPTHLAPSLETNPHNGDYYPAYNKPLAVIDFLEKAEPEEEWLVILDTDMILREPIVCPGAKGAEAEGLPPALTMPCKRGQPISQYYDCVVGAANELAARHIPEIPPRNNTDGSLPYDRRADMVGGMFVVHKDDMKQYMHDWLAYTEKVRFDPEVLLPPYSLHVFGEL